MFKRGTYWAGTGTYQAEFKRLRAALVPVDGVAETPHGELLGAIGNLYADLKRNGLRNIAVRWGDWHAVYARRDALVAALGPEGTWVFAVVDRAVTERYLHSQYGDGDELGSKKFPHDSFERLVDACVLIVSRQHAVAA